MKTPVYLDLIIPIHAEKSPRLSFDDLFESKCKISTSNNTYNHNLNTFINSLPIKNNNVNNNKSDSNNNKACKITKSSKTTTTTTVTTTNTNDVKQVSILSLDTLSKDTDKLIEIHGSDEAIDINDNLIDIHRIIVR